MDGFAFFIYFTFKGELTQSPPRADQSSLFADWKRLLLADGPRQSINGLILFAFALASKLWFAASDLLSSHLAGDFQTSNLSAYYNGSPITAMLLLAMLATVLIFAGSLILLAIAAVFYVPFLCYIQGNLKVR